MKHILIIIACFCPLFLFAQNVLTTLQGMHSVVKGETWEKIAEGHGVSVLELQAANPDVAGKKLKKGTLLILPNKTVSKEPADEGSDKQQTGIIRTNISDLKVGVMLPFSNKKMVEFYRGLLMAADSVRQSGVSIDIFAWDSDTQATQIEARGVDSQPMLQKLAELDVFFCQAPLALTQTISEVCKTNGTRLVFPFWNEQTHLEQDCPLLYNATASNATLYNVAAKKLMSYYPDKNYVVVHSGTPDRLGQMLTESVLQATSKQNVSHRTLELEADELAYESAFNQFRDNVIVLDDSSQRSLNILLARLGDFRKAHPDYRLSFLGHTTWQAETERLLKDFFALDTYIISPYYYNVLIEKTKHLERTYAKNFRTHIAKSHPRYAAMGFDLGHYFLQGLSSLGDTFELRQHTLLQEPYQNRFCFERSTGGMGFTNNFVQFIHFTTQEKIELIR